jgi:hypothetical protein
MRTIRAIQSGATLLALAGCVHTSTLFEGDALPDHGGRAASLSDRVTDGDSARFERTGFFQRESSVRGAYFVTPSKIAEMAPRTISDIFRHVPVLLENPTSIERGLGGAQHCFITYVNGLVRPSVVVSDLGTFIPARDVVAAEVYPPGQLPPAPFARASSRENCTTVALWTRSTLDHDRFNASHLAVTK